MDNTVAREGYLALTLCIKHPDITSTDEAFDILFPADTSSERREIRTIRYHKETEDIVNLKEQGVHAYELAYLFGVTANAIYNRIRKHKAKQAHKKGGQGNYESKQDTDFAHECAGENAG